MRFSILSATLQCFTLNECEDDSVLCLDIDDETKKQYDQWSSLTNEVVTKLGSLYGEQLIRQKAANEQREQYSKICEEIEAKKEGIAKVQEEMSALLDKLNALKP